MLFPLKRLTEEVDILDPSNKPLICIPVMGEDIEELEEELINALEKRPDLLEWRADHLKDIKRDALLDAMELFHKHLKGIDCIFTYRTVREGGFGKEEDYLEILKAAADSGLFSYIDVEMRRDNLLVSDIVEHAHRNHIKVIASWHDFNHTPLDMELVRNGFYGEAIGGDIVKIAVMPLKDTDLSRLKKVSEDLSRNVDVPLIIIAMGEAGKISRLDPLSFNSCMTFATAGKASAPGQIHIDQLRSHINGA